VAGHLTQSFACYQFVRRGRIPRTHRCSCADLPIIPTNMAIARCETCGQPQGTKQRYPHPHPVTNQPRTEDPRILCGARMCIGSALVWLTDVEEAQYCGGLRSFRLTCGDQVCVT
jgi:hypothetical protein